jgi:YYY domain-containing protein
LLGDVHPHVLALPFVLLVVALALNLLNSDQWSVVSRQSSEKPNLLDQATTLLKGSWHTITQATGGRLAFVLYALAVGSLGFLNTWDFPIYLAVIGLTFMLWLSHWQKSIFVPGIIGTGMLGVLGIVLYIPFYATFQSQAGGILPNLWNPTRLPQFFVFFGPFLVAVTVLLLVLSKYHQGWQKHLGWSLLLTLVGPVLLMLAVFAGMVLNPSGRDFVEGILRNPDIQTVIGTDTAGALVQASLWRRFLNPWTFLLVGGLLGWALALLLGDTASQQISESTDQQNEEFSPTPYSLLPTTLEKFPLILLFIGLGLTLAIEFIYLRDNFGIRMNTVFKFYFQAWVLLALTSAFAVYYVSQKLRGVWAVVWQIGMVLLVTGGLFYPILSIFNKTNNFQNDPTLNGIAWIENYQPGDYAAIEWLRENAPKDAVILEAPGASYAAYQYTGRVSAMTGLPTLLGWGGHQSQWRGNYEEPARREPDIEQLFTSLDARQTLDLLDKYNITYVYVGPLERERYPAEGLNKFAFLMDVVFDQNGVTIYRRR